MDYEEIHSYIQKRVIEILKSIDSINRLYLFYTIVSVFISIIFTFNIIFEYIFSASLIAGIVIFYFIFICLWRCFINKKIDEVNNKIVNFASDLYFYQLKRFILENEQEYLKKYAVNYFYTKSSGKINDWSNIYTFIINLGFSSIVASNVNDLKKSMYICLFMFFHLIFYFYGIIVIPNKKTMVERYCEIFQLEMLKLELEREYIPVFKIRSYLTGKYLYITTEDRLGIFNTLDFSDISFLCYTSSNGDPVYCLYNPNDQEYHYTKEIRERNFLISEGWNDKGIVWYSVQKNGNINPKKIVEIYRYYSEKCEYGKHTFSAEKNTTSNFNYEGVAWNALDV